MILGAPTLYRYDLLDRMIQSAYAGTLKPQNVLVVDNGGRYVPGPDIGGAVRVSRSGRNIGVAASWNAIMKYAFDQGETWVAISNDDILLGPDTLADLAFAVAAGSLLVLSEGMACFAITAACVDRVGWFDEHFWPAYYEDVDYMRRVVLAGIEETRVPRPAHHEGSATISGVSRVSVQWIHDGAEKNREYYERKWGGPRGAERFEKPFNGEI